MKITETDAFNIEKELCQRELSEFIKQAWHVIEPSQPYIHGWHIDAICEHLEAVTRGEINRLLINVPPGTMKSLAVGVFWPAWEWGPKGMSSTRYVAASHNLGFSVRDNVRMRRLVSSDWFQERWPTPFAKDQNAKLNFQNKNTGFRQAMAFGSMTGARGDRVIVDDPHSVEGAISDKERANTIRIFKETLPTRLNNPKTSAIIIVMQRLHTGDVSGVAIEEEMGYEHLMLPMEFEPERRCVTSIGFSDPRKVDGELLFPKRFPKEVVDRDKKAMGEMASSGQFQQRPTPRGGGMFKVENISIGVPQKIVRAVRYWDKAGTEGGGCYTAGVKVGIDQDGRFWILDVVRGQWGAMKREMHILQCAQMDGFETRVYVEQEPGSGGKESAESTIRMLAGYVAYKDRVTGDKVTRAEPLSVQVEAGNVSLKKAEWNKDFIEEARLFPVGKFKDQVDAAAGGFTKLTGVDVIDYEALTRM